MPVVVSCDAGDGVTSLCLLSSCMTLVTGVTSVPVVVPRDVGDGCDISVPVVVPRDAGDGCDVSVPVVVPRYAGDGCDVCACCRPA